MLEAQSQMKRAIDKLAISISPTQSGKRVSGTMAETTNVPIQEQEAQVANVQSDMASVEEVITLQQKCLNYLEDRMRRCYLIIFWLTEREGDSAAELENSVINYIFMTKIGVSVRSVERVQGICKRGTYPRSVIQNVYDYNEKMLVLDNCMPQTEIFAYLCLP